MFYYLVKIGSAFFLALLIYLVGAQQGCSPVNFAPVGILSCEEFPEGANCQARTLTFSCEEKPEQAKCRTPNNPSDNRIGLPPQHYCEISHELSLGKVDILFVIDNSSSMAKEHRSLAKQFNSFLNDLRDVQYHIAVITTDISSSPNNPTRNKYYQDGRFVPIGNRKYLKNENLGYRPDLQTVEDFKKAIEREETKNCDLLNQPREATDGYDRLYQERESAIPCPSSDERGIYAINLALKNSNHSSFFRPDSHLLIVILSDEDVRSGEEYYNQEGFENYEPEFEDRAESLIQNFSRFSNGTRSFSVFSIIIPPGDRGCLDKQNRDRARGPGSGRGYYGREYAFLSYPDRELKSYGNILSGDVISICSKNYGYQLRKVAVSAQTSRIPLACDNPESIDLYVNNSKVRSHQEIEGRILIIQPKSDIPLSARLKVREICPLDQGQSCN
ncbi:MAG: VWA domain-containing protein [Bdellovibrionaceae bacterium]|nr:VWA domain-containing protein [Pseudobdellovibrionaceae bacterium]